jgi:hypothetical protein
VSGDCLGVSDGVWTEPGRQSFLVHLRQILVLFGCLLRKIEACQFML